MGSGRTKNGHRKRNKKDSNISTAIGTLKKLPSTRYQMSSITIFTPIKILPFHTITIKDDIEHICVNETSRYANNLPSKSIMLSDIWRFDSISNIYVGLETDIPIRGPDEIGEDFWNNYTISVYSSDCAVNRRYWSAQSFTTQKNEDGSWNIRFIVKSEGGRCRVCSWNKFVFLIDTVLFNN
jgi:hypothetical protein